MRLIVLSSLFLIILTSVHLPAQDNESTVTETESTAPKKISPEASSAEPVVSEEKVIKPESDAAIEKTEKEPTVEEVEKKAPSPEGTEPEAAAEDTPAQEIKKDAPEEPEIIPGEDTEKSAGGETVEEEVITEEQPDTAAGDEVVETADDMDVIVEEDEDLLLIGEEEENLLITDEKEENLLAEEKKDTVPKDTVLSAETPVEEVGKQVDEKPVGTQTPEVKETETPAVESDTVTVQGKEDVEVITAEEEPEEQPIVIEKTRSIDFAKNLKEYRSPKKAMFMSLLLPGLGQAYTKKYWKTALFGVIEAAIIGFSVKFSVDGRDKKEEAREFADLHFEPGKFFRFYEDFEQYTAPDSMNVEDVSFIFGESLESYKNKYTGIKDKSYDYKYRQDYDRDIGSSPFVQGWDDCELHFDPVTGYTLDSAGYVYSYTHYSSDTLWQVNMLDKKNGDTIASGIYGYSSNQNKYNHMMSRSNHLYSVSGNILFLLLANHVISAVDAFISARAFNERLLNKQSLWQRINLDQQIAFTSNGFESRYGIRVRF